MLSRLRRYLFTRCGQCNRGFDWDERVGMWRYEPAGHWLAGEHGVYHLRSENGRTCLDRAMHGMGSIFDPRLPKPFEVLRP